MNENITNIARELLGSLWENITEKAGILGAYVIDMNSKEYYIDDTALLLLGCTRGSISFEYLCELVQTIETESGADSPVRLELLDTQSESISAGLVIKKNNQGGDEYSQMLGLTAQNALPAIIAEGSDNALLMLLRLEHIDADRDERSFINSAIEAMRSVSPENTVFSYHSRLQYWVFIPQCVNVPIETVKQMQQAVRSCAITDEFGVHISEDHSMTFTGGYVAFNARETSSVQQLHYASFALYEAISDKAGSLRSFDQELYDLQKNDYRKVKNFQYLLERNGFRYHFQPIVSAKDGSIFAYEALMRTDVNIGLNPLQILEMAQKYDRLYDIEHATLFNVLHHLSQNQYFFKKRKLFINSIPSSFLSDDDWAMLLGDYGELLEKVVIELTEQTDTSDENLNYLIGRLRKHKIQMAIDDYGTGYSNTSRLIRYTPDYIKLDHSLISHIDTNVRLQSIVSGLVEMMHSNGFAVLAEGVETAQEMRTLSHMNVDLFQGFYISRPKPIFIHEISEEIQSEIIRYHMESQGDSQKIYTATGNSTISMNELIREKYTSVYISDGEHILEGEPDMPAVIMPVTVKEEAECSLTIKNVKLEAVNDEPCITLGSGSRLKLDIVGENKMIKGGVQVPSKAELELTGGGKLTILAESVSCFAIGNEYDLTYGKIRCDMDGVLIINVCGDNCVGIGGGRSDDNSGIEITRGMMEISCSGAVSLGIGSMQEKADISISGCSISITAASANFTGIGSFESDADVKIHDVKLDVISGGNNQCALGSLHGGEVDILIKRCEMTSNIKGRNIINIGTNSSTALCDISNCLISLYAEGSTASGIGDSAGDGRVSIRDTELHITFMTSNGFAMGCRDGQLHFSGGTKQISINE